jgi:hypothetical protein
MSESPGLEGTTGMRCVSGLQAEKRRRMLNWRDQDFGMPRMLWMM